MDSAATAVLEPPRPLSRPRHTVRAAARLARNAEFWLVLVLSAAVFAVHDVPYLLRVPFWTDEAWVAVTLRFPLGQLPAVTSSTPIGWSLLLRLFDVGGQQSERLLPLAFAGLAVATGYVFARGLGWSRRWHAVFAGALAAVAALMSPTMLIRDDLKQYTADACLALAVLAALSRLEREWSRRRLGLLAAVAAGGMLLSSTTAFVAAAAFAGLALVQLMRRAWSRLAETAVAALAAGAGMGLVYEVFDARAVVPGLTAFWQGYYVPLRQGPKATLDYLRHNLALMHSTIGLGPTWSILLFALLGVVVLVRVARPATAAAAVALAPEMILVSALKKYPLLDQRTSTFLFAIIAVLAAVGVAGLCTLIAGNAPKPSSPRYLSALALAMAAVAAFVAGGWSDVRLHPLSTEDVRTQVDYVYAHRAPDDVILVNSNSSWGFAYYWPQGAPAQQANSFVLQKYVPVFPDQPQILVAASRDTPHVEAAVLEAIRRARAHPGARIWIVRTHPTRVENAAWTAAYQRYGLTAQPVDSAGLAVVTLGGG